MKPILLLPFLFALSFCASTESEEPAEVQIKNHDSLRKNLVGLISKFKGIVGVSILELESGDTLSINDKTNFATQSTYKFPLALAVLKKVEEGKLSLQQKVAIEKQTLDMYNWSRLKQQNPGNRLSISVDSLIMYSVAYSDNLACDKLFEVIGGPKVADDFVKTNGFSKMEIRYTEAEIGQNTERMYDNTTTPSEMSALLDQFYQGKLLSNENTKYLLNFMINDSTTHQRILGDLPKGTVVAHKTGTGIKICNDIGIIYLPNGKHIALSVYIMRAEQEIEIAEKLISDIAKQVYLEFNTKK